jgi:hypothetical protein
VSIPNEVGGIWEFGGGEEEVFPDTVTVLSANISPGKRWSSLQKGPSKSWTK